MSLKTGKRIHGYKWVELPITDEVIQRIDDMAVDENQPIMETRPIFEWTPGVPILDVDEDDEDVALALEGVDYEYVTDDKESFEDVGQEHEEDGDALADDFNE